jgi:carboxyl-terminal processing protease
MQQNKVAKMKSWRIAVHVALLGTLSVAVLGSTLAISQRSDDYKFFDPMIDIKHLLDTRYVEPIDAQALQTAAINGMLEELNDPFTIYVPPVDTDEFRKELTGEYVGIGALIGIRDDWLTVITPLDGSPALRAGVRADDRVIKIDGESTEGITADDAVGLLTGVDGTPVVVTVERGGDEIDIEITRGTIRTVPVKGHRRIGDDSHWDFMIDEENKIGYIWVTQFTPNVDQYFNAALQQLGADDGQLNGLIVDMRWNPGGVLEQAVRMVDRFVKEGTVVSIRGRDGREEKFTASAGGTLSDFPVVVLINEQSASASEIFAGALQDLDRAVVVGARTVGKGSVQSVIQLPHGNGAQLKMTEQLYYLPSGRSLQRKDESLVWGVDPTPGFYVPLDAEQTAAIILARQQADVIDAEVPAPADTPDAQPADGAATDEDASAEQTVTDPQLEVALEALRGKIAGGEWIPASDAEQSTATLALDEFQRVERTRERLLRELARLDRRLDTLESGVPDEREAADYDLWDDEIEVVGGTLQIVDAQGQQVATLRINQPQLERWLMDAGVERIDRDGTSAPMDAPDAGKSGDTGKFGEQ